jgi:microcystin-dependent protein
MSDGARLPVDQDLGISNEWSVMLWILPTDLTPSITNTLFEIHSLGSPGDDANSFRIDIVSPGTLVFRAFTSGGASFKTFSIDSTESGSAGVDGWFFSGTWSQIVVSWDGADFNMYRNGYLMNSDMTAVTDLAGTQTNTNRSISVGMKVDGTDLFTGYMHSAAYWSEALTQGAIRQMWNQGSGSTFNLNIGVEDYGPSISGTPSTPYNVRTLEAWWQLGKDTTAPVKDWTNNNNDLAVVEVEEDMPTGVILPFGGDVAPAGYLMCDGAAVSRATYAALFTVIGENYGAGDGFLTFNVPPGEGRYPHGKDSGIPDFDTLGNTGGEKDHQTTENEMPSHSHVVGYADTSAGTGTFAFSNLRNTAAYTLEDNDTTILPEGGGASHNNMSPYFVTNYIIQT